MTSRPRSILALAAVASLAACDSKDAAPSPVAPGAAAPADAAVDGITAINGFDPASGAHLDDDVPGTPRVRATRRAGRPIEIMLRSTPAGASVHADGVLLGTTPTMWAGETGEHEFTFVLAKHGLARYRFHAISTGVVHARLEPVSDERDPGMPPVELAPPQVAPPATVIIPDAGMPSVTPPPVVPAARARRRRAPAAPAPTASAPAPTASAPAPTASAPAPTASAPAEALLRPGPQI